MRGVSLGDALAVVGFLLLVAGFGWIYRPAALIFAGAVLGYVGLRMK